MTKFQVHAHIQVYASRAAAGIPGYPSGTRLIKYQGNDLLPDGYPGSEYLIGLCRIYLIGFSEIVQ